MGSLPQVNKNLKLGVGCNDSHIVRLMRRAKTNATSKYTASGRLKKNPPKPITLVHLKCLED